MWMVTFGKALAVYRDYMYALARANRNEPLTRTFECMDSTTLPMCRYQPRMITRLLFKTFFYVRKSNSLELTYAVCIANQHTTLGATLEGPKQIS